MNKKARYCWYSTNQQEYRLWHTPKGKILFILHTNHIITQPNEKYIKVVGDLCE